MMLWLAILGMGLVTFLVRFSFIGLLNHQQMPLVVQRALPFVPVAVLTAIIVPDLVAPGGTYLSSLLNARLIAGMIAVLVTWWTRNVLLTITVGMLALWLLQALGI